MPVLVDTGILLRAFVPADPDCGTIRSALHQLRRENEDLVTTFQNVAEFWNVSTRPATARGGYGVPVKMVKARVQFIERLGRRVIENDDVYREWKRLVARYDVKGVAVHDARLVATMLVHGIGRVLTGNDRDFRRYDAEGISGVTPQMLVDKSS
jgi:predicted nucleic acid-binding protein